MCNYIKFIKHTLLYLLIFFSHLNAEQEEIYLQSISDQIQVITKDLKTLEKAVYSEKIDSNNNQIDSITSYNSEDVLTRHLLKLSEIENQFQQLTNKFEEINFKLDKLSNRMSKVQADNQLRFQNLEGEDPDKKVTSQKKVLPGSSQKIHVAFHHTF